MEIKKFNNKMDLSKCLNNWFSILEIDGINFFTTLKLKYQFDTYGDIDMLYTEDGVTEDKVNKLYNEYIDIVLKSQNEIIFAELLEQTPNFGISKDYIVKPFINEIIVTI